jgi:hypothetical protein
VTVGIAARCQTDELQDTIICAADTQLSQGFTSSLGHLKFAFLGGGWLSLISANDLEHANRLISAIAEEMLGADEIKFVESLQAVLNRARETLRPQIAAEEALPPGLTLERFYSEGRTILPPEPYIQIWNALSRSRLDCELLVTGFDSRGDGHILTVGDEAARCFDRLDFAAIGSGALIAMGILSAYDHDAHCDWRLTAYRVFAAKKASERATGVGPSTTIARIDRFGMSLPPRAQLEALYDQYGPLPVKKHAEKLREEVAGLDKGTHIRWKHLPAESAPEPTTEAADTSASAK